MRRFLIWLSGARRQILDECPTERPKYVGIGASILITATMAAVSLAFALVTALRVELWLAMPFAIAWGLAILSLDRLFVVSLSREGGWPTQLLGATLRVLLALLLGFVISTPFVLQIFRPEIEHEITILHTQAEYVYLAGARNSQLEQQINRDQTNVNRLTAEEGGGGPVPQSPQLQSTLDQLNQAKAAEASDYNQWQCQLYGPCKPAGNGPLAMAARGRFNSEFARVEQLTITANLEQNQLNQTIASTQAKNKAEAEEQLPIAQKALQAAQAEQAQELSTFTSQNENNGGLLIRLQALDAVTSHDFTLNAARSLLFLLFVIIDCMPVMIKVMLNLGPENNYDRLLKDEEEKQRDVAAVNRDFRKAAEMMAARTAIREAQSSLAGWSAARAEVTQNIIATWKRVTAKKLEAWEKAETRYPSGEDVAMTRQTTHEEPPMGWRYLAWLQNPRPRRRSNGLQPQGTTSAPRPTAQSAKSGNSDESPQTQHPKQRHHVRSMSNRLSKILTATLTVGVIIPLVVGVTTFGLGWWQSHLATQQNQYSNGLADRQHKDDIEATYLGDMRDLLLNQHLSMSKPGSDVRQVAIEETVTTLQLLDASRNGTVLRFLRDEGLIGPQAEVIDLSGADLSGADLSGVNLAGVAMYGANLSGAHLRGATLTGALLSDAILKNADLTGARLGGAILTSADLSGTHLSNAILAGVDLAGTDITQPQLDEVHSCTDAILPAKRNCHHTPIIWLTYWYTESPAESPVILKLINQFNQNKQGIRIRPVYENFFNTRAAFTAAVRDGNAPDIPDILRSDLRWTQLFASEGYLLNIDSYAYQSNLDLPDYESVPLSYDKYERHLYGLPQVTDFLALLYNEKELAEAGITGPPHNMAEFEADVVRVVQKKTAEYGFETDGTFYRTLPFLYACGGGMLDQHNNILLNDKGSVSGLNFLFHLQNKDNVTPIDVNLANGGAVSPIVTDFQEGKTAMIFDGPYDVSEILTGSSFSHDHGNLGIAGIPRGPAGQPGSPLGGQSYVIYSGTAYPAEAYKFIEFMSSKASQIAIAEANYTLPTLGSAIRKLVPGNSFITQFQGIWETEAVAPPAIPHAAYLFDVADPSIRAALTGENANQALNTIANYWNQLGAGNELPLSSLTPGTSQTACS